ncbi:MAG: hypothetical protein Q4D38_12690 [Planctomycetia bacterium]|nr:hypothetical protein [Planctomycetia bacterium]
MLKIFTNRLLLGVFAAMIAGVALAAPPCFRRSASTSSGATQTETVYYEDENGNIYAADRGFSSGANRAGFASSGWNKRARPSMPKYDRPFPLGQVADAHMDTQQTNAEAADFILYDYEFVGDTATLTPKGREHMMQIAIRLPYVPFPVVVEQSERTNEVEENRRLAAIEETRRANVVAWLQKLYADDPSITEEMILGRVVVAPDFNYSLKADDLMSGDYFGNSSLGSNGANSRW